MAHHYMLHPNAVIEEFTDGLLVYLPNSAEVIRLDSDYADLVRRIRDTGELRRETLNSEVLASLLDLGLVSEKRGSGHTPSRRTFLLGAGVAGGVAAIGLPSVAFAASAPTLEGFYQVFDPENDEYLFTLPEDELQGDPDAAGPWRLQVGGDSMTSASPSGGNWEWALMLGAPPSGPTIQGQLTLPLVDGTLRYLVIFTEVVDG